MSRVRIAFTIFKPRRKGSFASPYNANFEWQTLTKAEVSLGPEWHGPRQNRILRSSGSFYSRGGALAHRVNPSSKTITIPGMAKRVSLLSSIPIPPPIYATSLLRSRSSPQPMSRPLPRHVGIAPVKGDL